MKIKQKIISRKRTKDIIKDEYNLPESPDGGWGWMILIGSLFILIITRGIMNSIMIFYSELNESNDTKKQHNNIMIALFIFTCVCTAPISSLLLFRYGCRSIILAGCIISGISLLISSFANNVIILILTIGFGTGIGFGLIQVPVIVSVTMYFEEFRPLTIGIVLFGTGIGNIIYNRFISFLFENYGWRSTLFVISFCVFECLIFGSFFRPLKAKKTAYSDSEEDEDVDNYEYDRSPDLRETKKSFFKMMTLFKDPIFLIFSISSFCLGLALIIPCLLILQKAYSLNINEDGIEAISILMGASNSIGILVSGVICNVTRINRFSVYVICIYICGLATIFTKYCDDIASIALYSIVFGLTHGAYFSLTSIILVDLFGLRKFTNAYGVIMVFHGIISVMGPPLTPYISPNYLDIFLHDSFVFAGFIILISGLILNVIPYVQKKEESISNKRIIQRLESHYL